MLQQNNNNNYPCLEMAASPRPALQQCPKTSLPFSGGRLELGDLPLVRGLRAWALCTKNRRRTAAPSSAAPGPRPADLYPACEWGRLGCGLGLPPLDSRQAGLGALVTVATLKASEGGGQTQTRCLVVRTEGGRCLYSTASPGTCSQGRPPLGSPSTLVGSWQKETGRGASIARTGTGDRGSAQGACRRKLLPGRRWRTSCRPAAPLVERSFQNVPEEQEPGARLAEEKQEVGDKGSILGAEQHGQRSRQDRGGSRSPRSCHATTQSCSRHPRRRGGQGSRGGGGGQRGGEGAPSRQSDAVEDVKQQEEEANEGTVLAGLKHCESSVPPASPDPELSRPVTGAQDDMEHCNSQGKLPPQAAPHSHLQEEKTNKEPTGSEESDTSCVVIRGPLRDAENLEDWASLFVDDAESQKDSDRMAEAEERSQTRLDKRIKGRFPETTCLEDSSCLPAPISSITLPTEGSTTTAEAETCSELVKQDKRLDVAQVTEVEPCETCASQETDLGTVVREKVIDAVRELCDNEVQSTSDEIGDPCEQAGPLPYGVRATDDEAEQVEDLKHGRVTAHGWGDEPGEEREKESELKEEESMEGRTEEYRTEGRNKENSEERSQEIIEEKESDKESRTEELKGEEESDKESRTEELKGEEESDEESRTEELKDEIEELVKYNINFQEKECGAEVNRTKEVEVECRPQDSEGELGTRKLKGESRPVELELGCSTDQTKGGILKKCRPEDTCMTASPAALTEDKGGQVRERSEGEVDSGHTCNTPSSGPAALARPATSVTHLPHNPAPPAAMATGLPGPERVWEAGGGASAELQNAESRERGHEPEQGRGPEQGSKVASVGGTVKRGQVDGEGDEGEEEEEEEEEEDDDDDFGLFMQAGEQPSWEDSFVTSPPVPCGNRESSALENHFNLDKSAHWTSGWTNSPIHQSKETWTAFPEGPVAEGRDAGGQWWLSCAKEETRDRQPAKQDLNTVFMEAFPCLPPSSPMKPEVVPSLTQLLREVPAHCSPVEDHGLLDGFHDLNKMIGWRYKRANAVSCALLLQSLHLDQQASEYISGTRTTNHSPSLGPHLLNQHAPTAGKRRMSYDLNKNIME